MCGTGLGETVRSVGLRFWCRDGYSSDGSGKEMPCLP